MKRYECRMIYKKCPDCDGELDTDYHEYYSPNCKRMLRKTDQVCEACDVCFYTTTILKSEFHDETEDRIVSEATE